jgi:hypothetical protein
VGQRNSRHKTNTSAYTQHSIYIPSAYVSGRTGTVVFGHANGRPVHNGIYYRGESNSRRAARRRMERQAKREARREGKRQ